MIKVNDRFILHSDNGMDYDITVVNINEFREPNMKYACEVVDGNGVAFDDFMFIGDEFFNSKNVERVVKE